MSACFNCPRVVPKVSDCDFLSHLIIYTHLIRCTAPKDSLDEGGVPRSPRHTELTSKTCTVRQLWYDYGIVLNIKVNSLGIISAVANFSIALYSLISTSKYP